MEPSWFASAMRRNVSTLGPAALATFDILRSLPVAAVRRNIAEGMTYAGVRGRDGRTLWAHQAEAVEALRAHLNDPEKDPSTIVVIPTAGGKTEIFVRAVEASGLDAGGKRLAVPTIVLEPTRQLVSQTLATFKDRFEHLAASSLDGGNALPMPVTVMSYDLFADMVGDGRLMPGDVGAIVMDEAHRGLSDNRQDLIGRFVGRTVITAYSATPAFDAVKNVHALLGARNEVINVSDKRLRQDGAISPVINYVLRVSINGTLPRDAGVRAAIVREATARAVCRFVDTHGEAESGMALRDKRYFAYTNGISRARGVARMLGDIGIRADSVSGADSLKLIEWQLGRLASGEISALVNDQVLVEGTDCPAVRGVLAVDPTISLVKHLQRCGRARRIDDTMDRFDPRQTSSVIEVMVEVNGRPLRDQCIYAEAIGDLSVAKVFKASDLTVEELVEDVLSDGTAEEAATGPAEAGDAADGIAHSLAIAADALADHAVSDVAPYVPEVVSFEAGEPRFPLPARRRRASRERVEGYEITDDLQGVHYLLRRREQEARPEAYLTRTLAAFALCVEPENGTLGGIFASLDGDLRTGRRPAVGDQPVRAGLYEVSGPELVPCLHADDLDAVRAILDIPKADLQRREGWLSHVQMATNFSVEPDDAALADAWRAATTGEMVLPPADDGGSAIRPMRQSRKWSTFLHPSAIPAFGDRLGRQAKFSFPLREDRHMEMADISERLSVPKGNPALKEIWNRLEVACKADGVAMDGDRRVDFDLVRSADGSIRACLGRDELPWLAREAGLRLPVPRQPGHMTVAEVGRIDFFRSRPDELGRIVDHLTAQAEAGGETRLPTGAPARFDYVAGRRPGYCLHKGDLYHLRQAVLAMVPRRAMAASYLASPSVDEAEPQPSGPVT